MEITFWDVQLATVFVDLTIFCIVNLDREISFTNERVEIMFFVI